MPRNRFPLDPFGTLVLASCLLLLAGTEVLPGERRAPGPVAALTMGGPASQGEAVAASRREAEGEPGARVVPVAARSASERPVAAGSIQGLVRRPEQARRRVPERYPGAARASARESPPVPVVVHLEGRLPGADAGADVSRMSQRDTTFIPPLVVVPVGTEVHFPNEDPFFHNVFSYSRAKRFDLGRYPQGESKSVRFGAPGYVKVFCEVHQWMRAGILVVENPFHQVVDEGGRFRIDGVPAGRHTLVVTDFERGSREVDVEVTAGGTARIEVRLGG